MLPPATNPESEFTFNTDCLDLVNLPWATPLHEWSETCKITEDLPHGKSRHQVVFLNCKGTQYVVKEMASGAAQHEYQNLVAIHNSHVPVVEAIGFVQLKKAENHASFLVTKFLERSLPYRILFGTPTLETYKIHLLDAIASLLVQIHLAGIFWGDCSLSNTLFRRDAGALQAYMVDAENSEIHLPPLMPALRFQDLQNMDANIIAEMLELTQEGFEFSSAMVYETGKSIKQRYHLLWEEITQEAIISPHETYQIQDRIRKINNLGYAIKEIEFLPAGQGDKLRLRIQVADRNFHRNQLQELTGLISEEGQAQKLMNEIHEVRARLTRQRNTQISIEAAAYQWLETVYIPTTQKLAELIGKFQEIKTKPIGLFNTDPTELYCQVLEHKWYLSERAQRDVGHQFAVEDFVNFSSQGLLYD